MRPGNLPTPPEVRLLEGDAIAIRCADDDYLVLDPATPEMTVLHASEMPDDAPRLIPSRDICGATAHGMISAPLSCIRPRHLKQQAHLDASGATFVELGDDPDLAALRRDLIEVLPGTAADYDDDDDLVAAVRALTAPAVAAEPHLVDASAPAMHKLMRRVQAGQLDADEAVEVLSTWPNLSDGLGRTSRDLRRRARDVVAATDREEGAATLPLRAAPSSHPDGPFVLCVDETPIVHGAAQAVLPPHVNVIIDMLRERHAQIGGGLVFGPDGHVDLDATYRTGTPRSDALVAESRALAVRDQLARAYHVTPEQVDQLVADARAQRLADEQADTEARQDDDRA